MPSRRAAVRVAPEGPRALDGLALCPPEALRLWVREDESKVTSCSATAFPGADAASAAAGPCPSAIVRFEDGFAVMSTSALLGDTLSLANAAAAFAALRGLPDVLAPLTALWRASAFDPAGGGLVPAPTSDPAVRPSWSANAGSLLDDLAGTWGCLDGCMSPLREVVHPAWLERDWGWFAPRVDPAQFGAPYLCPVGHLPDLFYDDAGSLGWGLFARGLDAPLATAGWDDHAALAGLLEHVRSYDPDTAVTAYTLAHADADEVRECREDFEHRAARVAARSEWAASNKIRPLLASRAIEAASTAAGLDRVHDFRAYSLSLTLPSEPASGASAPTHGFARAISLSRKVGAGKFAEFVRRLAEDCQAKKIGTVLVAAGHGPPCGNHGAVFLVRDVDFFARHAAVFGCRDFGSVTCADGTPV